MLTVTALTADGRLLDRIRSGRFAGTVHSIFDSVVNLRPADGGLVSLAARHVDNAPNTVVVDVESLSALTPRLGAGVVGRESHLVCPGLFTVDLTATAPWAPVLPDLSAAAASDVLVRMATELGRIVDREGQLGGIRPRPDAEGTIGAQVSHTLEAVSRQLVATLAAGDLDAATRWAGRLVGLGPGLTPSGDDFITGLAATIAAPGTRIHTLRPWVAELVRTHEANTNAISWIAMHEAARARVRESIVRILTAVAADDTDALRAAARAVIRIGKTSGTDIVTGMQAGLHLEKELRGVA